MKSLLLAAALTGLAAMPVMAQEPQCFDAGFIESELDANAGDQVVAELHDSDTGVVYTIRTKPDGKWIILATFDGLTCVVESGEASVFNPVGEPT